MKRLTKTQKKNIIQLYNFGLTPTMIGEQFGIFANSVNRIIRKSGGKSNQAKPITPQITIDLIIEKYNAGISSEVIAKEFDLNGSTICRILKRNNIQIRPAVENKRKYKIDLNYFANIDTEEKAYLLGWLYSDGNINKNTNDISIRLQASDGEILKKISGLIYGREQMTYELDDKGYETACFRITSKQIKQDLIKWGCMPAKSHLIRYPKIDPALDQHFIRGYFDGDGCISVRENGRATFDISSNPNFIQDMIEKLKYYIGVDEIYFGIDKRAVFSGCLQINTAENIKKIYNFLYQDATIYMARKYEKFDKYINRMNNDQV